MMGSVVAENLLDFADMLYRQEMRMKDRKKKDKKQATETLSKPERRKKKGVSKINSKQFAEDIDPLTEFI